MLVILGGCLFLSVASAQDKEFTYDSKGKRDPFIALVTPDGRLLKLEDQAQENTTLNLEGIIFDNNGMSYALVNSEALRVGDTIGEYQVLKIEKDKVSFIKEGQVTEIELKKEEQ